MKQYIIPVLAYVLTVPVCELFKVDSYTSYSLRAFLTAVLVMYFWQDYKLKFKFDYFAILIGILVFAAWIALENLNINFGSTVFMPRTDTLLFVKIFSMLAVAPFVEELFVRDFLARFFVNPDKFEKVKIGAFSWLSFIATVFVFGFSHSRWLQGIIAGILYNIVLYRTKNISCCVQAHALTNLLLAAFTVYTQNWALW